MVGWQRVLSIAVIAVGCAADPPSLPGGSGVASATGGSGTSSADDVDGDGGPGPSSADSAMTTADSAATTSGPSSTTDDPTGSVPLNCGDGMVDPDEECDDANAVELDGCTSSCQVGPIGLVWSEPLQDSDVVVWNGADGLDVVSDCAPGEVLNRIEVFTQTNQAGTTSLNGFIGRCSSVSLLDADPTALVLRNSGPLPTVGSSSSSAGQLSCDGGLTGFAARIEGTQATAVGATCRDYDVTGSGSSQSLGLGPAVNVAPIVGDGLVPGQATECPSGQVAVGLRSVLINGNPASLGLRCRQPSLLYP